MLLCDLHIHTTFSDGSLDLSKTVDIFGQAGFDAIAITDHVVNSDSMIGSVANYMRVSITEQSFNAYIQAVHAESKRALKKYGMLVIAGVEISKNYFSSDKSAHILLLDIKQYISADWSYEHIFLEAKRQKALIIACHPHAMSGLSKNTYYLWNNREKYAKYIDAWEVANRDDVFSVVGLKKFPYIANSDFHRARHLYSWKTLLNCQKNVEAIKTCIKDNRGVAIMLFRN
jgi:predicted metal-dependent phosphoesterase TrpH